MQPTRLLLLAVFTFNALIQAKESPNFIIILTDDHGWSSLSESMDLRQSKAGSDYHRTPNMDAILRQGMRFSNGYAAAPVCSPTRYSIQFGKTPARLKRTRVQGKNHADHNQIAIPQVLKSINPNYRCAHIGKWHIDADPERYAYDVHDGMTKNREGGFTMNNHKREWRGYLEDDPKRVHSITKRAIAFMEDSIAQERPFFLQLSHYAVHTDIVYSSESYAEVQLWEKGKLHKNHPYAAMTRDLDQSIGTLLKAYERLGLAENTYLIFTADNGGMPVLPIQLNRGKAYKPGLNAPLLRGKWDLTEGGIRVPFAVMGPNITAGSQSNNPITTCDLLPTLADLAGGSLEQLPSHLDGISFRPLLTDSKAELERPEDGLIFHFPHYNVVGINEPHSAIRVGDYKLLKFYASKRSLLFKISEDHGESNDLAEAQPERLAKLETILDNYLKEVGAEQPEASPTWEKNNFGATKTLFLERYP